MKCATLLVLVLGCASEPSGQLEFVSPTEGARIFTAGPITFLLHGRDLPSASRAEITIDGQLGSGLAGVLPKESCVDCGFSLTWAADTVVGEHEILLQLVNDPRVVVADAAITLTFMRP